MLKIYNVKDIEKCNYAFMGWDFAKTKFEKNDYEMVYMDAHRECHRCDLETLFCEFNRVTEKDSMRLEAMGFEGHSMSTSDLVLTDDGLFYCDSIGWEKVGE